MNNLKFDTLPLSSEMHRAIAEMGFQEASPIQSAAIPHLLEGRDIIGQAQTGTGKTAAFAIPTIERLDADKKAAQVLVLCPTRELAVQVAEEYKKLLKYKSQVAVVSIYGGQPINRQIIALRKRPQIIVGTPGRMLDHLKRGTIRLNTVNTVVLDEADEMLNMGFRDDIESILKNIPQPRQTVFFSATMPNAILQLTANYQQNPQHVKVERQVKENLLIEQLYFEVHKRRKLEALEYLIAEHGLKLALVFCNTKRQVDELVDRMRDAGYLADGIHGGMGQPKRDKVMSKFRKGSVQFLIATDVAARGIDVRNIEAVFNYDLPLDQEYYVHRIGRTGRAGTPGKAFTFIEMGQNQKLKTLKRYVNANLDLQKIPVRA